MLSGRFNVVAAKFGVIRIKDQAGVLAKQGVEVQAKGVTIALVDVAIAVVLAGRPTDHVRKGHRVHVFLCSFSLNVIFITSAH